MNSRAIALALTCIAAAFAGLAGPGKAITNLRQATCSQAEKQAAERALAGFRRAMPARRKSFFQTHRNAAARKAFLRRERARLRALEAAAACAVVVAPAAARVLATVPVGANRLVFANGFLWLGSDGSQAVPSAAVVQVDATTNQVVASVPIGIGAGGDVEFGFGSIWAVNIDAGTVSRIDPASHAVLATIPTGGPGPNGIAFSTNAAWVANHNEPPTLTGASVAQIDPATDQLIASVPVGGTQGGPVWLVDAAGSIWAFDPVNLQMVRIDPGSVKVVATIRAAEGGHGANRHFATDGTDVWTAAGLLLQRIDTAANSISTVVAGQTVASYGLSQIFGLTYAAGSIWLSGPCGAAACLLRVDAGTDAIVGDWTFPGNGDLDALELAYDNGSMWVSEHDRVVRLDVSS